MNKDLQIRFGTLKDLSVIVDIYNQAIRTKEATGDLLEYTVRERRNWFDKYDKNDYPIYVVEVATKVVGYCTLSPYRPGRKAMSSVAEISYYLDYAMHGKGIGTALLNYVIADCDRIGKKNLLAILLDINPKSVNILEKFNFIKWGHLPGIINLDGKICGHVIYGLSINPMNNKIG